MICNFSRRSGIEALAGKIRNGVRIELDDIRAISPVIITKSNSVSSAIKEKKTLKQATIKIIKLPWLFLKSKIEALIEFKLQALNQEILDLNKRIQTLETNNPPQNLIHRNKSWNSSDQNI
ncbi:MAG: hypothetical protein EBT92_18805 [Planctomycetes bacterium]|nr:hypothetical protein [Planctomycetota bacterium]